MDIDWISISPQNGAAGQNPVAFQLVAENETFEDKQLTVRAVCGDKYKDLTLVLKGKTYPIGTVWNFDYTGDVQQITLPKGKYKLQCWGAQGGSVTGTYAIAGSKGGYSEGVLTLTEPTTLYVFVGGKGTDYTSSASQTSTSVVNGGWNGGGAGVRTARYNSGDTDGRSFPRGGGGATDISTVTSAMSYSSGRTTRDNASLLARCIVAGGGAGASARYTATTTTSTTDTEVTSGSLTKKTSSEILVSSKTWTTLNINGLRPSIGATLKKGVTYRIEVSYNIVTGRFAHLRAHNSNSGAATDSLIEGAYNKSATKTISYTPSIDVSYWYIYPASDYVAADGTYVSIDVYANEAEHTGAYEYYKSLGALSASTTYKLSMSGSSYNSLVIEYYNSSGTLKGTLSGTTFTTPSTSYSDFRILVKSSSSSSSYSYTLYKPETTTSTSESSGKSSATQQGGGTSGKGQYPGTQSSAGNGGAFGLGASQSSTNYRYCAGGGGGGWYGGGTNKSDSSTSYVNYSGGGSGFVNTAANAASRPSGYTGLQLDSGTTKDGSTSFESTSGGTETGHSGNGYARITVLSQ